MNTAPSLALRWGAPILFVLLWSTGWIVARAITPYADPFTFLLARYAAATAAMALIAWAAAAPWPKTRAAQGHALVSGVLLHAIYLGGVWWAIRHGLPASISALLSALQPMITVIVAPALLGERVGGVQKLGVAAGLAGLLIVLGPQLATLRGEALAGALGPLAANGVAMLGITAGALYQKRFIRSGDLRTVAALQYAAAFVVTLPVAVLLEPMRIEWNAVTLGVLAWSVLAISIGAILLWLVLIRRGAVTQAASLVYLVPPTTALQAYFLFGERFTLTQIGGVALAILGVALANRR